MRSVVAIVALTIVPLAAQAAGVCDSELAPTGTDQSGYQLRTPDICEGMFVSRVGAPAMELVSLTFGKPRAGPAPPDLQLSARLTGAAQPLHIRAVGIPAGLYYRMDAKPSRSGIVDWHASDVLGKVGLSLDQIGLFGFYKDDTGAVVFVPIAENRAGQAASAQQDKIVVEIRPSTVVDQVSWRFLSTHQPGVATHTWVPVDRTGSGFTIPLTPAAAPGTLELLWQDPETGENRHAAFAIGSP